MITFLRKFFKLPVLKAFPLRDSQMIFSLDRLTRGVDNIRYDVYLSPDFCKVVSKIVAQVIAVKTGTEDIMNLDNPLNLSKGKDEFRRLCHEIMLDGINKAKLRREVQINYLVQTAVVRLLLEAIRSQYERTVLQLKNIIREHEVSKHPENAVQYKKRLTEMQENRKQILREAGMNLFQHLAEVQNGELREMQESNFGPEAILPGYVFSNPIFHAEDPADGSFLIDEYDVLLGRRVEDSDRQDILAAFIRDLLVQIGARNAAEQEKTSDEAENRLKPVERYEVEGWMKHPENVDVLFDYFQSRERVKVLKKQKADKSDIKDLRNYAKKQKKLLNFFYRRFRKKRFMERIVALYEMQPVYQEYCPPLVPHQVLQYLILPKSRKAVATRLRQLKIYYGKSFSLRTLRKLILNLEKVDIQTRKRYLIRFLRGFIRYYRDFQNFTMLREAMDCIHLTTKEDVIELSRVNNTLYEFLLPYERETEERPVIGHIIVKADIRGSTDVVHKMKEKGLNPATYFSLNFFDPITDILSEYNANKVCIEGDAYILSIYERESAPEDWYGVARACGLAISMLSIIRRYNAKNEKSGLPQLELGIGITYRDTAPTIFFDGDHQIMISSAINLADRLSGCSKALRKKLGEKRLFNLYVFQTASDKDVVATADDISLRYNVNGIEVNEIAFRKLSEEIDLKPVEMNIQKKKHKFYTGKFPTVSGRYQTLVIREAPIPRADPETMDVTENTPRNYYEVCTNAKVCEYVKTAATKREKQKSLKIPS